MIAFNFPQLILISRSDKNGWHTKKLLYLSRLVKVNLNHVAMLGVSI